MTFDTLIRIAVICTSFHNRIPTPIIENVLVIGKVKKSLNQPCSRQCIKHTTLTISIKALQNIRLNQLTNLLASTNQTSHKKKKHNAQHTLKRHSNRSANNCNACSCTACASFGQLFKMRTKTILA